MSGLIGAMESAFKNATSDAIGTAVGSIGKGAVESVERGYHASDKRTALAIGAAEAVAKLPDS